MTIKDITGQLNSLTYFHTGMSYTGTQFVHAPYISVEGLSVQGRSPEDYIVAQWFTESDIFNREFHSDYHKHQPTITFMSPTSTPPKITPYTPSRVYNPFEDESILSRIIKMDPQNIDMTIAFYNNYGPLNQTSSRSDVSSLGEYSTMEGVLESRNFFVESVEEIKTVVDGFLILEDIKAGTILTETEQLEFLERYNPGFWQPRWGHMNIRFEDLLQTLIFKTINLNLKPVSPYAEIFKDGNFYPGYLTTNLLGAAWFQIYNLVTKMPGRQVFRNCLCCGDPFVATSPRQKFCPTYDDVSVKHSPCENRYNAMKNRARKWIKGGFKTVEEVAEQLKRHVSEIESWLK